MAIAPATKESDATKPPSISGKREKEVNAYTWSLPVINILQCNWWINGHNKKSFMLFDKSQKSIKCCSRYLFIRIAISIAQPRYIYIYLSSPCPTITGDYAMLLNFFYFIITCNSGRN